MLHLFFSFERYIGMTAAQLSEPYDYVAALPSKGYRNIFIDAVNEWIAAPPFVVDAVKGIITHLHTASLLIDDIHDSSSLRRGRPSAHEVFGVARTLNNATAVSFGMLGNVLSLARAVDSYAGSAAPAVGGSTVERLVTVYSEEMDALHVGQGFDILWRETSHCPTLEEYRSMAVGKTGSMFRFALRLLAVGAACCGAGCGAPEAGGAEGLTPLLSAAEDIGYIFQVLDDLCNLCCAEYHDAKSYCEDVTEGKISFLVAHCVLTSRGDGSPVAAQLLELLAQRPTDVARKDAVCGLLSSTGSFAACRDEIRSYAVRLEADLATKWAARGGCGAPRLQGIVAMLRQRIPETFPRRTTE